jgi:hypothetical protein
VASANRQTIATSDSRCSEAGARRPADAWTADIESSTVTKPAGSCSVRPRQGRINATSPVTTCERLSFVEMWTVSAHERSAASHTAVSGVAAAKLPPSPTNTLAVPSRIARIASTVSWPVSGGMGMGSFCVQAGGK